MIRRKPRVVYWFVQPAPYAVERFNALVDRGNLDLEVWFSVERTPERSWDVDKEDWHFRARYIPSRSLLGWKEHLPLPELRAVRPDLLVHEYERACFAFGFLAGRACASRTAFRVLPTYDSWSTRTWWREIGKGVLFRAVDGAKVSGSAGEQVACRYGLPRSRTYTVTQSINVAHYSQAHDLDPHVRAQKRAALGLRGCVFIYVGRLWSGKGLDYLLTAFKAIHAQQPETSLLLVGDGIDEERYRLMAREASGVTFAGFVQSRDLPLYYALADVMVFPTLGDPHGLVVEEAMAAGLPVICTEAAGNIRSRVPDGRAGYVVAPADAVALAAPMLRLARDAALRARLAGQARSLVYAQDHDRYARDFEAFVEGVLSTSARRTPLSLLAHVAGRAVLAAGTRRGASPASYVDALGPHPLAL